MSKEAKDSALVIIENDQLRAQINVLREALLAAESALDESRNYPVTYDEVITALTATPDQSLDEYRNKVIEAFVNEFSRHVGGDGEFWLHELQDFAAVATTAPATPPDTSALEAIVKKAGEVMREKCAAACAGPNEDWNIFADDAGLAIRALPGVTLEELK